LRTVVPLDLLSPKALWLLGLLAPLVVLYILKVQRQRLRVASTWLWQQARRDLMARSPFKKLVPQVPLVLQALALIALAVAAARPATRDKTLSGDHIAIVVDTSASMSALDPATGKTRIELAKQAARAMVDGMPPGSDAMILDAGRDTRVALPSDRDVRRMHAAIDGLAARDVEGDLGAALALAVSRLKQLGGRRQIVVLTDGNLARPASLTESAVPMRLIRLGTPIDNAAIVRVDVRAGTDPVSEREEVQAFLLVANYGKQPRELFVTMRQDNASDTLASRKVVVPAGDKLPVVLTFHPAKGDYGTGLLFDVSPHDAMAVDDVAYGRVPAGRKLPVIVAAPNEPSPWVVRALVSDPDAEVRAGKIDAVLAADDVPPDAFVVIEGACPPAPPGGDLWIIDPPAGDCLGTLVGAEVEQPTITSWQHADDRMRFLTLDGMQAARARLLDPESKRQALITASEGVLAADVSSHARYATLLGFDVGESNWPLRASFVLFVRNLLEQARQHRSSGLAGPAQAGDPLRVAVPPAVTSVEVEGPDGKTHALPARGGLVVVPEVSRAGLYQVRWSEPRAGKSWIPVNLASPAESDLASEPVDAPAPEAGAEEAAADVAAHRDYSWVLALLALAFVMFDVWYFTRRPRRLAIRGAPRPPHPAGGAP
jgi:hypothetical protein